ncbi:DUF2938 family protein [Raoultella planticola]|uniref:DUF2938 family protein n=2 Tax=Raoultella planticola TaxID=575 RepID=UPI002B4000B5|nr:DUF2938 family protein [Raoultella planticola]
MFIVMQILVTGIGARVVMYLWSLCQKHILNVLPLNYALVGHWILWPPKGKARHNTIASTA